MRSLPRTITQLKIDLLITLRDCSPPRTSANVQDAYFAAHPDSEYSAAYVRKTLCNMPVGEYATRGKDSTGVSVYQITRFGDNVLNNLDQIPIVPITEPKDLYENTKRAKPRRQAKPNTSQRSLLPEPEPISVNISPAADALADGITAVIAENREYRKILLSVVDLINNALGLTQQGSENENGNKE